MRWENKEFVISDCRDKLDLELIYYFLNNCSYWAKARPKKTIQKSIDNSLCFGLFKNNKQIGFGRVVTDYATFAYLADVFIIEEYRGQGLGKWLVECIIRHPDLQNLQRWMLATADAHELYSRYGFIPLKQTEKYMEK